MSKEATSKDSSSAIFSPEPAPGRTLFDSPAGPTTCPSGPQAAPAHHSVPPARKRTARLAAEEWSRTQDKLASLLASSAGTNGSRTSDTYGPSFYGSSRSADHQSSLESRLQALMDSLGSPEFEVRWKQRDTPLGPPICAARGSARRTSDSGSGGTLFGLATPRANDAEKRGTPSIDVRNGLVCQAALAGQPTPSCNERGPESNDAKDARGSGGIDLQSTAALAGHVTPQARDAKGHTQNFCNPDKKKDDSLADQATLAGQPTPRHEDSESTGAHRGSPDTLTSAARLAAQQTPSAEDAGRTGSLADYMKYVRDGQTSGCRLRAQAQAAISASGTTAAASTTQTGKTAALNPNHSAWIMGFSWAWRLAALRACLKRRRLRSKRRGRQREASPAADRS